MRVPTLFLLVEMYQVRQLNNMLKIKKGVKCMSQTITVKVKLLPTKEKISLLEQSSREYIKLMNMLVSEIVEARESTKKVQVSTWA